MGENGGESGITARKNCVQKTRYGFLTSEHLVVILVGGEEGSEGSLAVRDQMGAGAVGGDWWQR